MEEIPISEIETRLQKMIIKKSIGEGKPIAGIIEEYGYHKFLKILISIINNEKGNKSKTQFYEKCLNVLLEIEDESKEKYPELWV